MGGGPAKELPKRRGDLGTSAPSTAPVDLIDGTTHAEPVPESQKMLATVIPI